MRQRPWGRGATRVVVQFAVFAVGLGLLAWCVSLALSSENRSKIERLGEAPASLLAAMLALSAASLLANGAAFAAAVWPVRRVPLVSIQAANAIATFLNNFPMKAGMIARVVIHSRRDRVPLLTIGAWFAAVAATMLVTIGPLIAATMLRPRIDGAWGLLAAGLLACSAGATLVLARCFAGEAGLARLEALVRRWRTATRLVGSAQFADLHAGFAMLASPAGLAAGIAVRLVDVGLYAARFAIAAEIIGVRLNGAEALTYGVAYFTIGALSPAGMLGLREAGTTGLAGALALLSKEPSASAQGMEVIPLLVGAAELVVNLTGAVVGMLVLRPDRLLMRRVAAGAVGEEPPGD